MLLISLSAIQGCAALWVADKAVDTAVFAGKTTAKAGIAAAEVTWAAGSAVAGAGEDAEQSKKEDGD